MSCVPSTRALAVLIGRLAWIIKHEIVTFRRNL
jgi:hypothetical protein